MGRWQDGTEYSPLKVYCPFDLNLREKTILGLIVVALFALGLFPGEAMRKTELAAKTLAAAGAAAAAALPPSCFPTDV